MASIVSRESKKYPNISSIICNNNLEDNTPGWVNDYFDHVIHVQKPGSYAARNFGIKASNAESYAFIDSDCIPTPGWFEELQKFSLKNEAMIASGQTCILRDQADFFSYAYEDIFAFNFEQLQKQRSAVTANLFVKKNVFDKVGLFDEDSFSGGDFAFIEKAKNKFEISYEKKAVVFHPARKNLSSLIKKHQRVYGGIYNRSHNKFLLFFYQMRPPINALELAIKQKKPIHIKISAVFILIILRMVYIFEHIKISFLDHEVRRK